MNSDLLWLIFICVMVGIMLYEFRRRYLLWKNAKDPVDAVLNVLEDSNNRSRAKYDAKHKPQRIGPFNNRTPRTFDAKEYYPIETGKFAINILKQLREGDLKPREDNVKVS